ncbi:MAG: hypothetical protein EA403_17670 [Spirochaetaceae bacterium]|nr:MAG: hypothetical protein EA403_17670 [Spirochaetaceae bacterium]
MADAPRKTPNLLAKTYDQKTLNRKVVRRIYLNQDRQFLASCFHQTDDGTYRLRDDLTEKEHKRAVSLAKQIRKNRGSLKTGRLVVVGVLIAAVVLFNILFKNALLTRAGEQVLQDIFEARAEISHLDLRLRDGSLSFTNISVADRDRPMRNLFEVGPTTIDVDVIELLKGNVVTRRATIENIRWNTERLTSGALPETDRRPPPEPDANPPVSFALPSLDPEDAAAFLQQHYQALSVPRLLDAAEQTLTRLTTELPAQIAAVQTSLDGLTASARELQSIDVSSITTVEAALTTARRIEPLSGSLRRDAGTIEEQVRGIASQTAVVGDLWSGVTDAVAHDINYLADRITDVTADPTGFVTGIVQELLREIFADVLRYAGRAQEIAAIAGIGGSDDGTPAFRSGGVTVPFPATRYPRFFLGLGGISFGSDTSDRFQEGAIRDLSSDPALIGRPTEFRLRTRNLDVVHAIETDLLLHRRDGDLAVARYTGTNLSVGTSASAGTVRLDRLAGVAEVDSTLEIARDGAIRAAAAISMPQPEVQLRTGVAVVDGIVTEAVQRAGTVDAAISVAARGARVSSVRITTNLDRFVADGVRGYLEDQRAVFEARLRAEVAQLVSAGRAELAPLEQRVTALRADANAQLTRATEYRTIAERKAAEIEQRIAELQGEAERRVQAEIDRARREAEAEADRARRQAEEEAERARREAEEQARREAERAGEGLLERAPSLPRLR